MRRSPRGGGAPDPRATPAGRRAGPGAPVLLLNFGDRALRLVGDRWVEEARLPEPWRSELPAVEAGFVWDCGARSPGGRVVVAGRGAGGARAWLGPDWRPIPLRRRFGPEPPERIESCVIPGESCVALQWTEPWLFDGADSHLLFATSPGARWRHRRIPGPVAALARGPGPLRVFAGGRRWERGALWRSAAFSAVDLRGQPLDPVIRDPVFHSRDAGFALHLTRLGETGARVEVLQTTDGGLRWRGVARHAGEVGGDCNEVGWVGIAASSWGANGGGV